MKYALPPIALFFIFSSFSIAAQTDHAHHHDHAVTPLALNQGQKWPIDDSLHIGMSQIKAVVEKNLNEIHHKTMTAQQYAKLAKKLQSQLDYLFKHCNLPAEADAQLHILLAEIMQGSNKMNSHKMSASENARDGAIQVIKALSRYPKYFNDSQWQGLQH